jgi:hypothetical protein
MTQEEENARIEALCVALESGDYEQRREYLRQDSGFCCLGVACDLSKLADWETSENGYYSYQKEHGVMPEAVRKYYGFQTNAGSFNRDFLSDDLRAEIKAAISRVPDSLIDLNDAGLSFSVIAKVIRARPAGLFGTLFEE